jgi:DNA invertase Pin-like site-specific DNA recombinase
VTATPVIKCAVWKRVSTDHQDAENQDAGLAQFVAHHGYTIARTWTLADSAWKDGKGGPAYQDAIKQVLEAAHKGEFTALVVWALDRISRTGAEDTLRLIRQLRDRGCVLVSVSEPWLGGSPEIQDVLVAFAAWVAQQESRRRSERIRSGIARRKAQGLPVGRKAGAKGQGQAQAEPLRRVMGARRGPAQGAPGRQRAGRRGMRTGDSEMITEMEMQARELGHPPKMEAA